MFKTISQAKKKKAGGKTEDSSRTWLIRVGYPQDIVTAPLDLHSRDKSKHVCLWSHTTITCDFLGLMLAITEQLEHLTSHHHLSIDSLN